MLIRGLAGVFTGRGFAENEGRRPQFHQADFQAGPIDIALCSRTGRIVALGRNLTVGSDEPILPGEGHVALPGWIDSHTHAAFAGQRAAEFFQRWEGRSYGEIAHAGGGIIATQEQTAATAEAELVALLAARFERMLAAGTVVVEVKSGYGRTAADERRLLRVIAAAARRVPGLKVVPTFLGLHAFPPGRTEKDYVDEMIGLLPTLRSEGLATFVDSFPEKNFFCLREALRFSEAAAALGFGLRAHADELSDSGSALAFVQRGAASVDHLQHVSDAGLEALATSPTVATLLPATSFYLGLCYADARRLLHAGARVALGSDYNPGTAPSFNLRFTALLAAANLRMTAAEILCALTCNAAAALGLQDTYGAIAPGKAAALMLCPVGSASVQRPEELLAHLLLSEARVLPVSLSGEERVRA